MADSEAQPHHPPTDHPSKYYYNHFFIKATIFTLFLLLLPLLPSQSPDSLNQTPHTRSWEVLQLIFVGIAVSYGLFSRKTDEIVDKENGSSSAAASTKQFDHAQSYVSRLLQVSSVFDDESEDASLFDDNNNNSSNKVVQTWNNQYLRGEPMLVVEEQRSVSVRSSKLGDKPLLLPVRSLKSRVEEEGEGENRKLIEDKAEENLVLPSPIPWRSRSGRMEMKEESNKIFSSSSLMAEDPEFNKLEPKSFRSQSFRSSSSRPNSTPPSPSPAPSPAPAISSPKKPSPPPEMRILEETARKKAPAPPPPPPHFLGKSSSMKSTSPAKELRRSIRSVPAEVPDEVVQNDAALPGKSARTFTPFNGRGRSYCVEKVKENLGKKDAEESEESEVEDEDDFFDENAAMVGRNDSVIADDNGSGDGGPDVDKKADEFIAKFREQIRLQRIESIRRTAGQAAARNQLVR